MSASTDRGVIVWAPGAVKGEFSPQIGMIKEQRANLDAVWNTRGDIFAVATTSGDVHIGTYSSANNFWVAHPFNSKNLSIKLQFYAFVLIHFQEELLLQVPWMVQL